MLKCEKSVPSAKPIYGILATDTDGAALAMMMRAVVVLGCMCVVGAIEAFAKAPVIADPHEDLFAAAPREPKPDDRPVPRPDQPVGPARDPAPSPSPTPAASELPANPLWSVPLSRLTATRERPPFSPLRRPPAPVAKPAAPVAMAPRPVEPERPQLSLVGTVVGRAGESVGLFLSNSDKSTVRLKAGENHNGWILRAVRPRQVELGKGLDSAVLDLPQPDLKSSAIPVPPAGSRNPPMPSSPASASLTVNSARQAGTVPAGVRQGATIVVQPPSFNPAPAAANPFRNGRLP